MLNRCPKKLARLSGTQEAPKPSLQNRSISCCLYVFERLALRCSLYRVGCLGGGGQESRDPGFWGVRPRELRFTLGLGLQSSVSTWNIEMSSPRLVHSHWGCGEGPTNPLTPFVTEFGIATRESADEQRCRTWVYFQMRIGLNFRSRSGIRFDLLA